MSQAALGATRGPLWTRAAMPALVHYASLVVAFALVAYLGRTQWFFFDEWTILAPDAPGLLVPHVGHLSAVPVALTWAIRAVVGVSSYWPYWLIMLATHVVLTHLLWRVMRRASVNPWVATSLAGLLLLFGAGSENILWAFQYGFVGAMALGIGVLLIVSRPTLGTIGTIGAAILALLSLATSGTSLPIFGVSILVALVRIGWRRTIVVFAVPVIVYAAWFLTNPRPPGSVTGISTALTFIPQFMARMLTGTFDGAIPVPGIGTIILLALAAWVLLKRSTFRESSWLLPTALLVAAVIFAALSAYSRYSSGLDTAGSSRYIYFVFAMALPALGAAVTTLVGTSRPLVLVASVLILATTAYNLGTLMQAAVSDGDREQGTRRQIYAALDYEQKHPADVDPAALIDPQWAPDLTMGDVVGMHDDGWLDAGSYTGKDLLDALAQVATIVTPVPQTGTCTAVGGEVGADPAASVVLTVPSAATISIAARGASATTGDPRTVQLGAGTYNIDNRTGRQLIITGIPGGTQSCTEGG